MSNVQKTEKRKADFQSNTGKPLKGKILESKELMKLKLHERLVMAISEGNFDEARGVVSEIKVGDLADNFEIQNYDALLEIAEKDPERLSDAAKKIMKDIAELKSSDS